MSRYPLSPRAAQVERRWEAAREQKDVLPWKGGAVSTENGNNFRTNQITVAAASDMAAKTVGNAVGLSATWACINLLAGTIASLPLVVYRTDRAGVRTVAKDHPLYRVLHDSANFDQTSSDFWEYQTAAIELQGNAYAAIDKRENGDVIALTPIRPDCVTARRLANGRIQYEWTERGTRKVQQSVDVLHIRGPMGDALSGASALAICRSAFDTALHADGAASTVFQNGARPSGVLSTEKPMKPEQRAEAQQLLNEKYIGAVNAGRPMLLDNGLSWTSISLSPEDVQMLDTRRFSVEEICRIFGIPPHMVGHTSTSTSWGTGLEQQTLGFVKFSLRRRLKRIEQALEKQLLTARDRAEGVSIEFNLEGLLRGDSASRAAFYQSGLTNGWRTINEVRALENLPPVPGGDVPRMQMQNVPITSAGKESGA